MWYVHLNREQHYLRSYRSHNLWFDQYAEKARTPRVVNFHIAVFKRLAKTYSGVSNRTMLYYNLCLFGSRNLTLTLVSYGLLLVGIDWLRNDQSCN